MQRLGIGIGKERNRERSWGWRKRRDVTSEKGRGSPTTPLKFRQLQAK
jgi:hypothetical protein